MTDKTARKPKHMILRPKKHVVLFFFVLMLSSGLMYLDMAMRYRP